MLSDRIAALRNRSGMSQGELARLLHISASTVGMYEQGRRTPNIDTLVEISKVFDVSLDYLITGTAFLYADAESRIAQMAKECPCSTCYWKNSIT